MWYRISFQASEFWNIDKLNDPKSMEDAFLGVIADSKKRTDKPEDIYKNLVTYKNSLLKENLDINSVETSFDNAVQALNAEFKDFDIEKQNVGGDWLEIAKSWIGTPYKLGGRSYSGIDCSAFVQKVFPEKNLPRSTPEQINVGTEIPKDDMSLWQPGDRIYFHYGSLGRSSDQPDHVGIYIGSNQMIQASRPEVNISELTPGKMKSILRVMR